MFKQVFQYLNRWYARTFKIRTQKPRVICLHHSAANDLTNNAATLFKEWEHRGEGYNGVIDADKGPATFTEQLPEEAISNGVYGYNYESWNLSVDGNFEINKPTPQEIEMIIQVCAAKAKKWGWTKKDVWRITYHQEVGLKYARTKYGTACPGKYLIAQVPYIRKRVADYLPA